MRSAKQAIALFSLTFAYAAFGQTGGTITGLISDPAGAVVPNAPVEAGQATNIVFCMAMESLRSGRRLRWNPQTRQTEG